MASGSSLNCTGPPPGNDSCNFEDVDQLTRTLRLVVYIPTSLLALPLNLLAIRVFHTFLKWSHCVATSIYMINLAVFDLLLVLSVLLRVALDQGQVPFLALCTLAECFYFVSMYGSLFTICFISLDRFLAIRYPIPVKSWRSPGKVLGICCSIWILVWAGSSPLYNSHAKGGDKYRCFHNMSSNVWSAKVIVPLELFGFLLPTGVVGFCSCSSVRVLLGRPDRHLRLQRACVWAIASSLAVFVASFLPVHLAVFLQFLVRNGLIADCRARRGISLFLQLSFCLSNTACCLDVFCYYFATREFRRRASADRGRASGSPE